MLQLMLEIDERNRVSIGDVVYMMETFGINREKSRQIENSQNKKK